MAVLSEEQTMLRDMAREWTTNESPVTAYRKFRDLAPACGYDANAFKTMAEMGWAGIVIPESYGGSDFGWLSLGLVLEETAKTLTASPLAASALAASALVLGSSDGAKAAWLPRLASGEVVGTLAIDEGPRHNPAAIATTATKTGSGWSLSGGKAFVHEAHGAALLIVAAQTPDGVGVFAVPADAAGLSLATRKLTDARSHADVTLANVQLGADAYLGGSDLLDRLLDRARIVTAAEMLGLAEHSFAVTLDYLKQRVQFDRIEADRPIRIPGVGDRLSGLKTSIFLEVEGAAHYLPAYAGTLDIMTSAGLRTAERMAVRMLQTAVAA